MFVPRLEAPSYTDKNWIVQSAGGRNPCIPVNGNSALPNCFAGDTKIITRDGIVRLDDIVGKTVEVLTDDGTYHTATGVYGGKQPVYKLTFRNSHEYVCTASHEWLVVCNSHWKGKHYSTKKDIKSVDLNTHHCIPYVKFQDIAIDRKGIQNGFIYGDGTLYNSGTQSVASLCGYKREYMRMYFDDAIHTCSWGDVDEYYPYPKSYKYIPAISKDLSYLKGFICGLLASDGTVDTSGCPSISTSKEYDCTKICEILSVLGYRYSMGKTVHDTNYKKGAVLYRIYINKNSISADMFLNPIHKERFSQKSKNCLYTRIKSIEALNETMDVYCVSEPITHTFTLADGMITKNCTGFVIGRMLELYGDDAYSLPWQENAGQYYLKLVESSIWKRSSKPSLGCVICWSRAGQAGHVAVVEKINPDNSIVTSESAYMSTRFYTQTLKPPYYTWSSAYVLQGFIYNTKGPSASSSKIEDFIKTAKDLVGKKASSLGLKDTRTCSTGFVVYCAKQVPDVLGTVIPDKDNPTEFTNAGTRKSMGTFLKGPLYNRPLIPKPGDILLARVSQTRKYNGEADCDFTYIVTDIKDPYVKVVGIGADGRIELREYKDSAKTICGYYRPKWSLLENSTDYMVGYAPLGKFYESESTSEDATIREVGYLDNKNKPTINKSSVKLSVVNYTTMLASVMDDLLVPSVYSGNIGDEVIVDGVQNSKARECIQFLMGKGLNAAAACGICGNIEAESVPPYNTASKGDYVNGIPTSYGVCQWHYGRGEAMKRMAGSNWENNLTGQLEYLWYELQNGYKNSTLIPIQGVPNTEQGARQAADIFVRRFEVPANVDYQSQIRQNNAAKLYSQLVVQMTTSSSGKSSVAASNKPFSGKTVEIPQWISQDGISPIYTNYSYWYSRWATSSLQYKISRIWSQKGSKSNRHIATIDGMYLIAVKPIYGTNGDKVSVVLEDGTVINCIIADIKANENGVVGSAIYGHNSGSKINIIEFEAVSDASSVYIKTPMDLTGWQGKAVKKIINGGSIL